MSHTITVRLSKDLAAWLAETAERTGIPQGKVDGIAVEREARAEWDERERKQWGDR